MGNAISVLFEALFGSKEVRILMLGLDNAGKTSILCKWFFFFGYCPFRRGRTMREGGREGEQGREICRASGPPLYCPEGSLLLSFD